MNLSSFIIIGAGESKKIFNILTRQGLDFKSVVLLGDNKTFQIGGNSIAEDLKEHGIRIYKKQVIASDEPAVRNVTKFIKKKRPGIVISIGGGKVLDVGKLAAGRAGIKHVSIPTTLSNDGIASPVSVIKNRCGIPISHLTTAPYGVIVDIDIVKRAPDRYIKAGVGDLISNLSAVFDARLSLTRGKCREKVTKEALKLAGAGARKLLRVRNKSLKSHDFLNCLTEGLIQSGLAMCKVGSSKPASGSEHKISHALDFMFPKRRSLHGEQVGFAALITMALQKNRFLSAVKKLYAIIGFPQKISFFEISTDKFIKVILDARNIRPERYTILEDSALSRKKLRKIIKRLKL